MIVNGERALAYIAEVTNIEPIPNCDNIVHASILGWKVIINKNDGIKVGDKVVYFEVDSKVNEKDERFAFLEKRNYRIKTMKMRGVYSQGLVMPLSLFPEIKNPELNMDVTKLLGVTYYVSEDNVRKASNVKKQKYDSMASRHKNLMKKKPFRWLMRREWGRKLLFLFLGKKKDKPRDFPSFIKKTDEERIENMPWILDDHDKVWLMTEKLDGTSSTYVLRRLKKGKNRYEFYVCSRNVRQQDENQKTYHDYNIYWDMAFKYDIEKHLTEFMDTNKDVMWVCIQGESVGKVQGNPLKLEEDDLYVFNFITDKYGRFGSNDGKCIIENWGMKWVPILGSCTLLDNMEDMKLSADGKSVVNPNVLREGIVYRSIDGKESFKNVSRKYALSRD